jgi:fimbrial chaperone protein
VDVRPSVTHGRLRAAGLVLGLLVGLPAAGATFKVSPIQIYLSPNKATELLTVENQSAESVRLQVTAFAWSQSSRGDIQLAPTEDVVFFPALLTLEPGKERKIRIGVAKPAGAVERTYRVFVEELPPLEKPAETGNQSEVKVLTRFGVPIFVQPGKLARSGAIEGAKLDAGSVKFRVTNTGNTAFSLISVRVAGAGADGTQTFETQAAGWYVLAGGDRLYEIAIPVADCRRTTTISLEARTEHDAWKASLAAAPEACGTSR